MDPGPRLAAAHGPEDEGPRAPTPCAAGQAVAPSLRVGPSPSAAAEGRHSGWWLTGPPPLGPASASGKAFGVGSKNP